MLGAGGKDEDCVNRKRERRTEEAAEEWGFRLDVEEGEFDFLNN